MSLQKVIIDCDPGVDDAVALLLAFACRKELELLGVTTVAGNVGVAATARNARIMRQLAGREDVPVLAGSGRPLVREPVEAGHFHGVTGLGSLPVFEPRVALAEGSAVHFIAATLAAAAPRSVSLVVMGPMTNIAMALRLEPRMQRGIREIVVMGGARAAGGNITASAEYNVFADPHAAHIVYASGCPIVAIGLDATHQVCATPPRVARIRALGSPVAQAAAELLAFSNDIPANAALGAGAPLHDPCTIAYLLQPGLFTLQPCYLRVETESALTLGHTAVEFRDSESFALSSRAATPPPMTVRWATHADSSGIFDLLTERLAQL